MTADGIDHGKSEYTYCLEALIEKFEDGYVLCPILYSGGSCEECYEIFEQRLQRKERINENEKI